MVKAKKPSIATLKRKLTHMQRMRDDVINNQARVERESKTINETLVICQQNFRAEIDAHNSTKQQLEWARSRIKTLEASMPTMDYSELALASQDGMVGPSMGSRLGDLNDLVADLSRRISAHIEFINRHLPKQRRKRRA